TARLVPLYFKREISRHTISDNFYIMQGRSNTAKKLLLKQWLDSHFNSTTLLVYIFFDREGGCLYTGRTGQGGKRPLAHFDKNWISLTGFLRVFEVKNRSQLYKLECLAMHHFHPRTSRRKPCRARHTKACPVCAKHRQLAKAVKSLFLKDGRKR
ncbi:MAG TPA: hypothetical protein VLD19_13445, partial [Chitinophagaceae bacterium]|nr:hypothetical protein [Chitinophagaceae bacterium]